MSDSDDEFKMKLFCYISSTKREKIILKKEKLRRIQFATFVRTEVSSMKFLILCEILYIRLGCNAHKPTDPEEKLAVFLK